MWIVREKRVKVFSFGDLFRILYFLKCICFWVFYLILLILREIELLLFFLFCLLNS